MKVEFCKKQFRKQSGFKCWRPILDEHGHPTRYHQHIREMIASSSTSTATKRTGKYFSSCWYEKWHFKAPKACFCSIRTFATRACLTQANNGTAFAERFELADPTNSSARIETVEIKSIKRLPRQPKPVERSS